MGKTGYIEKEGWSTQTLGTKGGIDGGSGWGSEFVI